MSICKGYVYSDSEFIIKLKLRFLQGGNLGHQQGKKNPNVTHLLGILVTALLRGVLLLHDLPPVNAAQYRLFKDENRAQVYE